VSAAAVEQAATVKVVDQSGQETGEVTLSAAIFGVPADPATLHQAVVRQQANSRQGTHETKTRGEVSGGGKKPWRQKGTGRARQGSTRAPQWRHGGTVFGPHPHGYEQRMPRKQRRLALRAALSDRARAGAVKVVEEIRLEAPRTKAMASLLHEMSATAPALLVLPEHDLMLEKSTRNLPGVKTILVSNLNLQDVLSAETVVFTRAALSVLEAWLGGPEEQA
jgi:large subunit ribosomal protein L4